MKSRRRFAAALVSVTLLASASHTLAANAPAADAQFSHDQLEQLVAPIALYPDSLLTQVMMASTYPLEVVEASRWLKKNPDLKADKLDAALKDQDWDASVKGLCTVPDVVHRMSDNLDWTQDLGDAFLAQQSDVLAAVQVMRSKAYEAGNLKTSAQQKVVVEQQQGGQVIVVEPAQPEVIYVPTYSSTVVYGPSYAPPAPYYPAMYAPPGYGLLAFGAGMAVGAAIWGDSDWGCCGYGGNNNVNVNVNNYNNFNNRVNNGNINRGDIGSGNKWQHNAEHRKGVNYRNSQTAEKFGAKAGQNRVSQGQARGYGDRQGGVSDRASGGRTGGVGAGAGNRASGGVAADRVGSAGNRGGTGASAGNRASGVGSGAGASNRAAGGASNRGVGSGSAGSRPSSSMSRPSSGGSGAFSRSGSSSMDRSASMRGASSRGGGGFSGGSRGGFGGGRGGGGGGGGRGGRR